LSLPENSTSHAKDVSAKPYTSREFLQETGNRGQKVLITELLNRFYNNTAKIIQQIKEEQKIRFYNFSDGKRIKYLENSNDGIYQKLLDEPKDKEDLSSNLKTVDKQLKEKIKEQLKQESILLKKQTAFLRSAENLKPSELIKIFVELFVNKNCLFSQTGRFLLNDFRAKHTYRQENMDKWILEQKNELLKIAMVSKELIDNAINLIKNNEQLPDAEKGNLSDLDRYKFYAVIRERFLDSKGNLKRELSTKEFTYLIESFLNTFQPVNYQQFHEILSQFKNNVELSEQNEKLYQKGINRCIEFYLSKYRNTSDVEINQFIRKKIEILLFESDRISDLIKFINSIQTPLPYEIELLADSYKTTQEYENSSLLYKALIKNNLINQKIILNYFESLIKADKLAEALYFNAIIKDKIQRVLKYTIASNLLKKKILTFLDEKNSPKKIQNTDKKTKSGYITFTNKQITEDSDKIIGLISKQQDLPFFKNESKYYYDKEPDTQFFIDEIVFSD
jgi:hypothetical protein